MENKPSTARIALKYGIFAAIVGSIYSTIILMTDLAFTSPALGLVSLLILGAFIYLAIKEFKSENGDFLSVGEGIGVGVLLSVVTGVIGGIYNFIYQTFIDPEYIDRSLSFSEKRLIEQGLSEDQIEAALEMTQIFSSGGLSMVIGVITSIIFGLILTAIIAAILKKNKPVF